MLSGVALTIIAARCRNSRRTRWGGLLCGAMVIFEGAATWLEGSTASAFEWMHWLALALGFAGIAAVAANRGCTGSGRGSDR